MSSQRPESSRAMELVRPTPLPPAPIDPSGGRYVIVHEHRRSQRPGSPALSSPPPWKGDLDPMQDPAWQRLWLAVQRRAWTVLAVVPASSDAPSLRASQALAAVGWHHLGRPVEVIDATALEIGKLEELLDELDLRRDVDQRTIVALASTLENPACSAAARAADAAVLCLRLGDSLGEAEKAIDEVGVERLIGSFVFNEGASS